MNTDKSINSLVAEYVSEQDMKPDVQKNTLWVLQRFVNWMVKNRIDVRNPRKANIIHYKTALIGEKKSPTTVNRYMAPVRGFYGWLDDCNIYENITLGVKRLKDDRRFRKEYLRPEQARQLLQLIPLDKITGMRDYAMINLMLMKGLRRVEISRLTVGDIDRNVLTVRRKGRLYTEDLQLEEEVLQPIINYLTERCPASENEPMFGNHSRHHTNKLSKESISRIVKSYLVHISDNCKLTCHSLRHTGAITLLKSGKSIYDVQQFLGHSTIKSTEPYLRAIEQEQRFNNTLSRDLIDTFKNDKKTAKIKQIMT